MTNAANDTEDRVRPTLTSLFERAGVEGFVHVRDIDSGAEFGHRADERTVLASVFKIPIALEYARQVAAGTLDPAARHTVSAAYRSGSGAATDGCRHDVEASTRDLAFLMMTISDNAATDLLLDVVGPERVRATLDALGHPDFGVASCAALDDGIRRELGLDPARGLDEQLAGIAPERLMALSVNDPGVAPSSTPSGVTALLAAIWRDEAGPSGACAEVRSLMSRQVWQHRLVSGFPGTVRTAGKTGTDFAIRNEAGVVEYPDGGRYAVGVFLRTPVPDVRQPRADRVIGEAAKLAVDHLRG
ncbi:serine hydrolase [Streptomyces sp. NBC_00083]|uniref:serine hydrolase n=1 Tax=Streptomyces sp. NBC_00083 TaxID=2975647 RepID=UPI0022524D7C|nr:serine hydrolase [Streptomyces sp. NBC_00083]MCX5388172.1 class A beta-lactamase-related serine hydrolase [Streptomyces sp. NBC_00083]